MKKLLDYSDEFLNTKKGDKYLDEVIDHPELFKYYPDLKDVKLSYNNEANAISGLYNPSTNSINAAGRTVEETKDTLIHEIQHYIQNQEGFASGGSPKTSFKFVLDTLNKEKQGIFDYLANPNNTRNLSEESKTLLLNKFKSLNDIHQRALDNYLFSSKEVGDNPMYNYEFYKSLYGEIEANNVSFRRLWDEQQQRDFPPELTEFKPKNGPTIILDE